VQADGLLVDGVTGAAAPTNNFVNVLDDLTDVTLGAPSNNDCLVYNGSAWQNGACTVAAGGGQWALQYNSGGALAANNRLYVDVSNLNPSLGLYDGTDTTYVGIASGLSTANFEVFSPGNTHRDLRFQVRFKVSG
jgi:hypothetical protein